MKKWLVTAWIVMGLCGPVFGAESADVHVSSLSLDGEIDGENIVFELSVQADARSKGITLPLVSGDVAYLEGRIPRRCELIREGNTYLLRFKSRGKATVRFKFASRPIHEGEWRRTRFEIPGAGVRRLSVLCDRDDLEIVFPGALDVQREKTDEGKMLATAFLGVADQFEIGWKPEVKKLDAELVVTCDANMIATASVGALRLDTILTYRIVQGRLDRLAIRLPDVNVTQVRGNDIQDWHIDRSDPRGPLLHVNLGRPMEGTYRLQVESELVLPEFPSGFTLPVFAPENVIRSSGFAMIGTDSAIRLQIMKAAGVTQVDQEVFPTVTADRGEARTRPSRVLYTYQYAGTPYAIELTADDIVTELTADDRIVVRLAEDELALDASFEISVKDAPTRELIIEAAAATGWTVTDISGAQIVEADVDVQELNDKRIIQIPFASAVSGTVLVNVRMEKALEKTMTHFVLPDLKVVDAKAERGYIVLAAEKGVRLKSDAMTGMREVHTGSAPMRVPGAQQAFRFREPGWSLALQLERANPAIHCEVFHLASIGEGVAYHSVAMTYHIGGAPVQEMSIVVPEDIQAVEFTGADIEGWTREEDLCTVRLQDRVLGDYTLLVTYDSQLADDGADIEIGRVATRGTESEVGYMAVASSLSLDVREASELSSSLIVIDRGELPSAYAAPVTDPILRAYKILRAPHPVTVRLAPYDSEQLLGQIADYAGLQTKLSRDGEAVTTASYYIKNATRQHLVVRLPEGAALWSIQRVDGTGHRDAVLSQESGEGLLIPVNRPLDPNTAIEIEVTYAQKLRSLGFLRTGFRPLVFEAAILPDTHATFASWTVQVPVEFAVGKSGGNMRGATHGPRVGVLGVLRKAALMGVAVLDGPSGVRVWKLLRDDRAAGQRVEFKKTLSLAGVEGPVLKLWLVPGWLGRNGSALFLATAIVGGLVLLLLGTWRGGRIVRALGGTLLIVGLAEAAAGRTLLATLLLLALLLMVFRLFRRMLRSHGRRRRLRREQRAVARMAEPPPSEGSGTEDIPPFEPDPVDAAGNSGSTRPALLLGLCAALALLSTAAAAVQEPLPDVATNTVVMESVTLEIVGPVMDRHTEHSADVTATLEFEVDCPESILILPANTVLKTAETRSDRLEIVAGPDGYRLNVLRRGSYTLRLEYQAPVVEEKDGAWSVHLLLPDTMKNKVTMSLPGTELEVSSAQAVLLEAGEHDGVTRVESVLGPARDVTITWRPRARKTKLEEALYFCEVNTLAVLQSGVIDMVNLIKYQVARGELREMQVMIPQGAAVSAVQAPDLATWSFEPGSGLLDVILETPVSGDFELRVMTQISRDGLPYDATLGVPAVQGATRQRGSFSIGAPDSVQLRVGAAQGLSAMNIEDFSAAAINLATEPDGAHRRDMMVRRAYRYNDAQEVTVEVATEQVLPEIRVTEEGSVSIADERIVLATKMTLRIARSGLFFVELSIPADYEVESLTGPDVSHWDEGMPSTNVAGGSADERSVIVHFSRRLTDSTLLNLVVARMEKGIEKQIPVPRVKVADARKHDGRFTVSGERGVRLMVESRSGVDIKKASEEGIRHAGVLVFDILRPSWALTLKAEVMAPQIKPEVLQWVDLSEGMLQCRVYLRYMIENAGVNSFRLQVPYPETALTVAGRNVARVHIVDKAKGIWEVNLHGKVDDLYSMRASYQLPYDTDNQQVSIQPLRTLGTEPQRGYLVVTCGGRVQVTPDHVPDGLKQENARSVPAEFGAGDLSNAVLCYRTLRPGYDLTLSVVRHESAAVLPAGIDRVRITSVVSPGRRLLTKVELAMTVGDLRFLRLTLPEQDDELWTVLVNGKETAASQDNGIYRIPLEQEAADETSVELIYAGEASSGRLARRQKYMAPRFPGLPLNDIEWTLYVSPGLRYYAFGGTLRYDVPEYGIGSQTYTAQEYQRGNLMRREASILKAREVLDEGAKLVQSGRKKKEAQRAFQQALNYSQARADLNEDARVQLRNLVKQQVKIGLVNRRDANRFSQNIVDEQQLGQMEQYNDGEYTQEYVSNVESRLSAKDSSALDVVADKMIDQQAAAAGVVTAISVTMPEDGVPLRFTRALQIDPESDLSVTFKAGSGWAGRSLGSIIATLLLFAACWFIQMPSERMAASKSAAASRGSAA